MLEGPITVYYDERHKLGSIKGPIRYIGLNKRDVSIGNPLAFAAQNRHDNLEPAKTLLKRGADVNQIDIHGKAPLLYAAKGEHLNIVKLLLKHGANINITDRSGFNALYLAVGVRDKNRSCYNYSERKRVSIVKLLLDKGIKVSACTVADCAPLMAAVGSRAILGIVKALLKAGADASRRNISGETCLLKAVWLLCEGTWKFKLIKVIVELIRAGSSIYHKYEEGGNSMEIIFATAKLNDDRKVTLIIEVVRITTLKEYPKQLKFENIKQKKSWKSWLDIAFQVALDCYNEVGTMKSIRLQEGNYFLLRGPTFLNGFALHGSKDWKVFDTALDALMKYTFRNYHDSIVGQFTRLYFEGKISELGLYLSTDYGNIECTKKHIRELCEYLSNVDLINLIEVLVKSPSAV